jgi:hypothetical protein
MLLLEGLPAVFKLFVQLAVINTKALGAGLYATCLE